VFSEGIVPEASVFRQEGYHSVSSSGFGFMIDCVRIRTIWRAKLGGDHLALGSL
jgi:hypothetical protein